MKRCVPLSACPPSSDRLESLFLLSFNAGGDDETCVRMRLLTERPMFTAADKVIFIFAGRKEGAFLPFLSNRGLSDVRVILVIPETDVDALSGYVQSGIDLLVVERLVSATHGEYEQLGLINSRRLAAFHCAMMLQREYHIPHALMADDNLHAIHFNPGDDVARTHQP